MTEGYDVVSQVAELDSHLGYQFVIHKLEKDLSSVENQMEQSTETGVDHSLLAQWKQLRKVIRMMKSTPKDYAERLSRMDLERK